MTLPSALICWLLVGASASTTKEPESTAPQTEESANAELQSSSEEDKAKTPSGAPSQEPAVEETDTSGASASTESLEEGNDQPPSPAVTGESEEKKPTLRRRRTKPAGDAKTPQDPVKKRGPDQAPEVPARNIPAPDARMDPPSELDKELLGELGQDLEVAEEEQDPLMRAGRRMREVEEKLARLEASDPTIELQDKILADLDELLKQRQSGKPPPKNQQQNQKKRNDQQQMAQQQQRQQGAQQRQEQGQQAAEKAGPARSGREEFGTPKEVKDVWGHLSELMREEMSQYAKEGFLEKYREMLEQYYSTIATRSSGSE